MLKNRFYFVTFVAFLKVHLRENLNTAHKAVSQMNQILLVENPLIPPPLISISFC
jgi:hypothetical protein